MIHTGIHSAGPFCPEIKTAGASSVVFWLSEKELLQFACLTPVFSLGSASMANGEASAERDRLLAEIEGDKQSVWKASHLGDVISLTALIRAGKSVNAENPVRLRRHGGDLLLSEAQRAARPAPATGHDAIY